MYTKAPSSRRHLLTINNGSPDKAKELPSGLVKESSLKALQAKKRELQKISSGKSARRIKTSSLRTLQLQFQARNGIINKIYLFFRSCRTCQSSQLDTLLFLATSTQSQISSKLSSPILLFLLCSPPLACYCYDSGYRSQDQRGDTKLFRT